MLDMLGTPWITSTSPGCARLCASNSAIRLTWRRAPSSGSMRWRMLRTVSAGPAMVLPGMVGRSTDAPMTPDGMPSSSIVSEMMPVGSPSAMSRSTTPCGARGTAISLMFSAAMRPVNRFVSATVTGAPPDHQALLYRATLTCSRAAHKAAHRGRSATRTALREGGHCGRTACPGERRSLPLPPFRHSGLHSHGIRTAPIDLIDACPRRAGCRHCRGTPKQKANPHDRSLCAHQPQRAESLRHARGMRAAVQGAFRRRLEGRPVQAGIFEGQSEQQDSGDRRSRRPGRQAVHRDRVRARS